MKFRRLRHSIPDTTTEGPSWLEVDQAWSALDLVTGWVKHAETKLGLLLAAGGVSTGALFSIVDGSDDRSTAYIWCVAVCAASAVAAVASAIIGLVAITRAGTAPINNPFFFAAIARNHATDRNYRPLLSTTIAQPRLVIEQLGQQIHANAQVASRKYRWANVATWALFCNVLTYGALIGVSLA